MTEKQVRLPFLDSIRGIAAFLVVLSHCWLINSAAFRTQHAGLSNAKSPQNLFFYFLSKIGDSGRSAVIMFFVLSGFVLASSLGNAERHQTYKQYLIRRFFRIYPTFIFALIFSFVLHSLIGNPHPSDSEWMNLEVDNITISLGNFLRGVFLVGTVGTNAMDNVIWTLVYEVRISILFPLIFWSVVGFGWRSLIIYLAMSFLCSVTMIHLTGSIITGFR